MVVICTGCDDVINVQSLTHVNCYGSSTGSATVAASSVLNPANTYVYVWSNAQVGPTLTNVPAGTYMVTAMPSNGCTPISQSITIGQPATAVNVYVTGTDESSIGANDGTALAIAAGGTPGYTYLWNTGATTQL